MSTEDQHDARGAATDVLCGAIEHNKNGQTYTCTCTLNKGHTGDHGCRVGGWWQCWRDVDCTRMTEQAMRTLPAPPFVDAAARLEATAIAAQPVSAATGDADAVRVSEEHRDAAEAASVAAAKEGYRFGILEGSDHIRSARHIYAELLALRTSQQQLRADLAKAIVRAEASEAENARLKAGIMALQQLGKTDESGDFRLNVTLSKHHASLEAALTEWGKLLF